MSSRALLAALLAFLVGGCHEESEQTGPDEAVRRFVNNMRQVHGDVEAGEAVVNLLWEPARDNLKERAKRASALSGRELVSGELVVPSWFALHLNPKRYVPREDGDWAEVTVHDHEGNSVQVRCIKESGDWKVALELPPLAPIRQREEER